MKNDAFWEIFTETGDPVCWLLSRTRSVREPTASAAGRRPEDGVPSGEKKR